MKALNNTFIKFMKSDSMFYEINGELSYSKWIEMSASELGITRSIVKEYGSIENTIDYIVKNHPVFIEAGWDLYKILK